MGINICHAQMGNLLSFAELEQELGVVHHELFELREYKRKTTSHLNDIEEHIATLANVVTGLEKQCEYLKGLVNGIELQCRLTMKNSQNNFKLINDKTTQMNEDLNNVRKHSIMQVEKIKQETTAMNPKSPASRKISNFIGSNRSSTV
jgi:chromosome segregation ATPase